MTSFMFTSLSEQANLGLKSDKGFKSATINAVARVISAKFDLAEWHTCEQSSLACKKNMNNN